MRVKLISMTENPIDLMWTAARTCYSEKSPISMIFPIKKLKYNPIIKPLSEWIKELKENK